MATFNNGESGLSVRNKLNTIINKVEGVTSINNNIDVIGTVTADGLTLDQTTNSISTGTSDGSDNARLFLNGGGSPSINRGGNISVYGNEYASSGGNVVLAAGDALTGGAVEGHIRMITGPARNRLLIEDNGDISFYDSAGSSQAFFWDAADERLGLGTTTPEKPLHVNSGTGNIGIRVESTDATSSIEFLDSGTTSSLLSPRVGGISDDFFVQTSGAERMRIDSSGNLLVGKTANNSATTGHGLTSAGLAYHTRSGGEPLYLNRLSSDGVILTLAKDGSTVGSIGARGGDVYLETGNTGIRMYDASEAIIPVGNTGVTRDGAIDLGLGPNLRFKDLYLSGAMYGGGVTSSSDTTSRSSGNAFSGTSSFANWTSWGTGAHTHAAFRNGTSQVGYIQTNTTSTTYSTSSDYRLKTDAQPMTGASARVQALNPVNFEWIADGTRVDGFLAHEAQTVVPEAVTGAKDAMRDEEYEVTPAVLDEDGNEVTPAVMGTRSVPDYQGIDQSKLVPLLTAALQEALTKIDDLETRLTALEGA